MIDTLHYAENGVHQCWTCRRRCGITIYSKTIFDIDSIPQVVQFYLPQCEVADQYMLYTTKVPCEKYECDVVVNINE